MKAIVTGANGFVGSYMCKLLLAKKWQVKAMILKGTDMMFFKSVVPDWGKIELVYGDVTDLDSLKEPFTDVDVIFNIAGRIRGINQKEYDEVNVKGNINVCKAVLKVNPNLKRLIFTSSLTGCGPGTLGNIRNEYEEPFYIPGDKYGFSKWKMEKAIQPYLKHLPYVIVRPPAVLGPGDLPSLDLYKMPKLGIKLTVAGEPKYYTFLDVEDLCDGMFVCATNDKAIGETFYLSNDEPIDFGTVQELIGVKVFGRKPNTLLNLAIPPKLMLVFGNIMDTFQMLLKKNLFLTKSKALEGNACGWSCSSEKARNLLGWKNRFSIADTVQRSGDWYKKYGLL